MVEAGETEIARDELVWLLSECPDYLDAHVHLGLAHLGGQALEPLGLAVEEAAGAARGAAARTEHHARVLA